MPETSISSARTIVRRRSSPARRLPSFGGVPSTSLIHGFQQIAQAAEGDDAHRAALEFLAQPMDVYLDRIGAGVLVQTEHLGRQLILAHDPPGTRDQRLVHGLLARGQAQRLLAQTEAASVQVVDQYPAALLTLATGHA